MRVLSLLAMVLAFVGVVPRVGRHVRAGGRRTRRVRPYVSRVLPITPAPPSYEVVPRGRVVRPYVLDVGHRARLVEERRRAADEQHLALAVLMDLGTPVEPTPAEDAPVERAPVESAPVGCVPVERAPVESAPVGCVPGEGASVGGGPVESVPPGDMAELADVVRRYLARPAAMWHCPVAGCLMAAPRPVAHPCPLTDTPATAQMAVAA